MSFGGSSPSAPAPYTPPGEKPAPKDAELRAQKLKQYVTGGGIAYSGNEYDELMRSRRKMLGAANDILG